jgi:small-conductance mechanosensitive channel
MKTKRWFILIGALLVIAIVVALGYRFFRIEDGHLLLRTFEEPFSRLLNKPFFQIGSFLVTPITLLKALIYCFLLGFLARMVSVGFEQQLLRRTPLDEGQQYNIRRIVQYTIVLIGIIFGLDAVGLSLSSLAVFGGALGIGIGLGLQDTANNFVAGIILMFERPVKVSDRIEVGDVDGRVERIGARATWVRTNDNIVIVIPNSDFVTKQVINWTANDRTVRFIVPFGVSYNSNPEQVRDIVLRVARTNRDVLDDPAPDVIFTGFGDSSIDFELRVWTSTQVHRRPVIRSDLYFAIFRSFRENNIEIPFPQRDLHLRSVRAPLTVERPAPPQ